MPDRRVRGVRQSDVTSGYDLPTYLSSLGVGGVVMAGALSWECFPRNTIAASVTAGAANTDGTATEMVPTGDIGVPYYVTHLAWALDQSAIRTRWKIQEGTTTVRTMRGVSREDSPETARMSQIYPPYKMAANASCNAVIATATGTETSEAYLEVMRGKPIVLDGLMNRIPVRSQTVLPLGSSGIDGPQFPSPTTNAIPGAWGDYVEIDPGQATGPYLIYGVSLLRTDDFDYIAAFATGAAQSEVDWGRFGMPVMSTNTGKSQIYYDLRPWPVYVPPDTRLSGRCQYVDGIGAPPVNAIAFLDVILL